MRDEKPCQKFNLVVYYEKNKRLRKKPIFHENVYIYNGDGSYIYAYDAKKFDADEEDPIVEIMDRVTDTCFKYCGIWIDGLEHSRGEDNRANGETYWYQRWLITSLNREQLEEENWYGY